MGYLKELILLANNNYENLEGRYNDLVEKSRKAEENQVQREKEMNTNVMEMKNILTNIISIPPGQENIQEKKQEPLSTKNQKLSAE